MFCRLYCYCAYLCGKFHEKQRTMVVNEEQLEVINAYSFGEKFADGTVDVPDECFLDVLGRIWRHFNYSIDIEDPADIDSLGLEMDRLIGENVFRK